MTNKPGRTGQRTDNLKDKLVLGLTRSGDKCCACVSLRQYNAIEGIDIFS